MKNTLLLLPITLMIFSGCATTKEYTVRAYAEDNGMWTVEAATRRKDSSFKKSLYFLVECPPDSVGSRFMFRKGTQIAKYKPH